MSLSFTYTTYRQDSYFLFLPPAFRRMDCKRRWASLLWALDGGRSALCQFSCSGSASGLNRAALSWKGGMILAATLLHWRHNARRNRTIAEAIRDYLDYGGDLEKIYRKGREIKYMNVIGHMAVPLLARPAIPRRGRPGTEKRPMMCCTIKCDSPSIQARSHEEGGSRLMLSYDLAALDKGQHALSLPLLDRQHIHYFTLL